jgi:hypothetical protein
MTAKTGLVNRIWLAFGVMGLLLVCMAVVGNVGVREVMGTTEKTLVQDAHASEEGLQALTSTLALRRWEKDYFENMGLGRDAFFMDHWHASRADLEARIDTLDQMTSSADDHATFREMRRHLAAYGVGFEKVTAAIKSGQIASPEAANLAIGPYKDDIRAIETSSVAIGTASRERTRVGIERLHAGSTTALNTLNLLALLALLLAVLVGFFVRREMKVPGATAPGAGA